MSALPPNPHRVCHAPVVALDASRHVLAIAGIKPPSDSVSVSVGIELRAGYVIDLSERDEPPVKIVGGHVIDAKPVE